MTYLGGPPSGASSATVTAVGVVPVFNPRDPAFGALGNGTGNDLPAFKAALAAAKASVTAGAQSAVLEVPRGYYIWDFPYHLSLTAPLQPTNPANATVATGGIASSATSVTVQSVTGTIPAPGYAIVETEVIAYTTATDNGDGTWTLAGSVVRDYIGLSLSTAAKTHSATTPVKFTVPVTFACDATTNDPGHYPAGGGKGAVQDPNYDDTNTVFAHANFRYTAQAGGVFTNAVFDLIPDRPFDADSSVLDPVVDAALVASDAPLRVLLDVEGCDHITMRAQGHPIIDIAKANSMDTSIGIGSYGVARIVEPSEQLASVPLVADVCEPGRFVNVGAAAQPNPIDGTQTGNTFKPGDIAKLETRKMCGYDRATADGYIIEVADPGEWSTRPNGSGSPTNVIYAAATTATPNAPSAFTVQLDGRARKIEDPKALSTTLSQDFLLADTAIHLTSATALGYKQTGWLWVDDTVSTPAGGELVYIEGPVDASDPTVLKVTRRGTAVMANMTAALRPSGAKVRSVEVVRCVNYTDPTVIEYMVYDQITNSASLRIIQRGVNATTPGDWRQRDYIFVVNPPGRVRTFELIEGGPFQVVQGGGATQSATTAQTLTGSETYPFTIKLNDVGQLEPFGVVQVDRPGGARISYQWRDRGNLYGCRHNADGTTWSGGNLASGGSLMQVGAHTTLAAAVAGSGTATLSVNGAHTFRRGYAGYVRVGQETILLSSAPSSSTVGSVGVGGFGPTDTTIPLAAGNTIVVDGSGIAVVKVDTHNNGELVRGQVSGNTLINCERGYWGTAPSTQIAGANITQINQIKATGTNSRASLGTTAAAHSIGDAVLEADGAQLRPLKMLKSFNVQGNFKFVGRVVADVPRIQVGGGLGASQGGRQQAFYLEQCMDMDLSGFEVFHTERGGVSWFDCLRCQGHHARVEGANRQGFGAGIDFIRATRDCSWTDSHFYNLRHAGICSAAGSGASGVQRHIKFMRNIGAFFVNHAWESQNACADVEVGSNHLSNASAGGLWASNDSTHFHDNTLTDCYIGVAFANLSRRQQRSKSVNDTIIRPYGDGGIKVFVDSAATNGVNGLAGALCHDHLIIDRPVIIETLGDGIIVDSTATGPGGFNGEVAPGFAYRNITIRAAVISMAPNSSSKVGIRGVKVAGLNIDGAEFNDWPLANDAVLLTDCVKPRVRRVTVKGAKGTGAAHAVHLAGVTSGALVTGTVGDNVGGYGVYLDDTVTNSKVFVGDSDLTGCTSGDVHLGAGAGNTKKDGV